MLDLPPPAKIVTPKTVQVSSTSQYSGDWGLGAWDYVLFSSISPLYSFDHCKVGKNFDIKAISCKCLVYHKISYYSEFIHVNTLSKAKLD